MTENEKTTALIPSVGADGGQPPHDSTKQRIPHETCESNPPEENIEENPRVHKALKTQMTAILAELERNVRRWSCCS